jgi:hypothetical protein
MWQSSTHRRSHVMTLHLYRFVGITLLVGVLSVALPAYAQTHKHSIEHGQSTHEHSGTCTGFVVLPNGYAVLSGMEPSPMPGMPHDMQHGATPQAKVMTHEMGSQMAPTHQQTMHESHGHTGEMSQPAGAQQYLMGYHHGQDITPQEGMLCVPIGRIDATTWASVSHDPSLYVRVESLRGALTHNSRANEAFALTVMRRGAGTSDKPPTVRLLARMPQHDRQLPGGHGLANDPDVQGLEAQPDEQGRYRVPTVDFSMAGDWLVEVQVQQGGKMSRAYFAVDVGEE